MMMKKGWLAPHPYWIGLKYTQIDTHGISNIGPPITGPHRWTRNENKFSAFHRVFPFSVWHLSVRRNLEGPGTYTCVLSDDIRPKRAWNPFSKEELFFQTMIHHFLFISWNFAENAEIAQICQKYENLEKNIIYEPKNDCWQL